MSPRLKVSSLLIERLKNVQKGGSGKLYGVWDDKTLILIGLSLSFSESESSEDQNDNNYSEQGLSSVIVTNFPVALNVCGVFTITEEDSLDSFNEALLENIEDVSVVFNINFATKKVISAFYENGKTQEVPSTIVNHNELMQSFMYLRVTATVPLGSDVDSTCMLSTLNDFQKKILAGSLGFQLEEKNIYILGENEESISKSSIKDLQSMVAPSVKGNNNDISVCNVEMFLKSTSNSDSSLQIAPFIKYTKKQFKHMEINLTIDTLVMVLKSMKLTSLHQILVEGVHRNYILNKNNLIQQLEGGKIYDICLPETYHFLPSPLGHFISIVYSSNQNPDTLKKIREAFHKTLSLPMDTPLVRQANAYDFSNSSASDRKLLVNPHEKVGKSGVNEGNPAFVQGYYAYHHYMQENFDDNGWGCAYRSLQTICSWFRFQGYTNVPVPTHKDIQQCLVNIGDKPRSFVGSRQWIGSTEVSFVLETMLGVTSRIVSVSSGEEMLMKGGELTHHFNTQGTPIMIGGGVLAHTILGVDYNKKTGDIKFLILDPHYTGGEDLNIIINKGWCGWKGPEFWKKDAFYNMCLPLRPKCV